eukprot:364406-Chlamydomonas_euryale.AAC.9
MPWAHDASAQPPGPGTTSWAWHNLLGLAQPPGSCTTSWTLHNLLGLEQPPGPCTTPWALHNLLDVAPPPGRCTTSWASAQPWALHWPFARQGLFSSSRLKITRVAAAPTASSS